MSADDRRVQALLATHGAFGGYRDVPALDDAPDELPLRFVAEHDRLRAESRAVADRTEWPTGHATSGP